MVMLLTKFGGRGGGGGRGEGERGVGGGGERLVLKALLCSFKIAGLQAWPGATIRFEGGHISPHYA